MKHICIAVVAMAALPAASIAQSNTVNASWLCVIDQSTGFAYSKNLRKWTTTNFSDRDKYLISPIPGNANYKYKITKLGEEAVNGVTIPQALCKDGFSNNTPFLHCSGIYGTFSFNKQMGRIIHSSTMGYFNVATGTNNITDETSDTPFIEIGTCSPL